MAELTNNDMNVKIYEAKMELIDILDEYCDTWELQLRWSYPEEEDITIQRFNQSKIKKDSPRTALKPGGMYTDDRKEWRK